MTKFDAFIGIDWSGAKGDRHRGIAVFICEAGGGVPQKIPPPDGKKAYARSDVITLLQDLSNSKKILVGIDFAFAYPVDQAGHYFPDLSGEKQPDDAPHLWRLVDDVNRSAPDYYGGVIWDHPDYGPYYNAPGGRKGAKFASRRRVTERAAAFVKSPSPTFNCVGPAGVGTGSLAGMRLCHYFAADATISATIWPFIKRDDAALTLVEIFPSAYFKMAGINPVNGAQAEKDNLNHALSYFGSAPVGDDFIAHGPDGDDADALISSAALRYFAQDDSLWDVPEVAAREGWIFGMKSDRP